MSTRLAGLALSALLAGSVAGCASGPTYPLLTPVEVAHDFGFSDVRLPDGRYQVSYVAPSQRGFGYRYDQSPTERQGKTLAYDMAIWRAAQIAEAQGFKGFAVADSKSNADIQQRSAFYDDPFGGPWGPAWGPGPYWSWHRPPYGWGDYNPPETSVQVQVSLDVALSNDLKPGDYNAADAIQQLRQTYPGADGGAIAPPPQPVGPTVKPVTSELPATPTATTVPPVPLPAND